MEKLLQCYPFSDQRVRLVEGFSAYDGVIGDVQGTPHKGIDYVLQVDGSYQPFDVYAMHNGMAFRGESASWGNFVIIHSIVDEKRFSTVYAHLATVDPSVPVQFLEKDGLRIANKQGILVPAGQNIGVAGTSGSTNGITQLHLEFLEKYLKTDTSRKLDPYGVDDRASSGRYPQPGHSLHGLNHAWMSDEPQLARY